MLVEGSALGAGAHIVQNSRNACTARAHPRFPYFLTPIAASRTHASKERGTPCHNKHRSTRCLLLLECALPFAPLCPLARAVFRFILSRPQPGDELAEGVDGLPGVSVPGKRPVLRHPRPGARLPLRLRRATRAPPAHQLGLPGGVHPADPEGLAAYLSRELRQPR